MRLARAHVIAAIERHLGRALAVRVHLPATSDHEDIARSIGVALGGAQALNLPLVEVSVAASWGVAQLTAAEVWTQPLVACAVAPTFLEAMVAALDAGGGEPILPGPSRPQFGALSFVDNGNNVVHASAIATWKADGPLTIHTDFGQSPPQQSLLHWTTVCGEALRKIAIDARISQIGGWEAKVARASLEMDVPRRLQ